MALRFLCAGVIVRRMVTGKCLNRLYSTQNVSVTMRQGFPILSLPLPSVHQSCDFLLRPYLQTVGDLATSIHNEDAGIQRVSLYMADGNKIASSTGLDVLLQSNFDIQVNDVKYHVEVPDNLVEPLDGERSLSDVRNLIHKLYTSLNVDRHQVSKELELRSQLDKLTMELQPLEQSRRQLAQRSERRTNAVLWTGLAWMSLQFGFFARLTWWEYSWDIMEPVTYFWTYGTSILIFTYFVLTRQDYTYPDAHDRQYLNFFSKMATRHKFDVDKYNHLKDAVAKVRGELDRLRDPLQLNLPTASPGQSQNQNTSV